MANRARVEAARNESPGGKSPAAFSAVNIKNAAACSKFPPYFRSESESEARLVPVFRHSVGQPYATRPDSGVKFLDRVRARKLAMKGLTV